MTSQLVHVGISCQVNRFYMDFVGIFILPLRRRGGYTGFVLSVLPSVRPSVRPKPIFSVACFSAITHHSHFKLCFGYRSHTSLTEFTSASYLILVLQFSLFSDISWSTANFRRTLGVYLVSSYSQISCINMHLLYPYQKYFSFPVTATMCDSLSNVVIFP